MVNIKYIRELKANSLKNISYQILIDIYIISV
nr:MAG TPA: hypothetical protein [Caudoviricetes sp.]